jgi:hypothetical protein
MQALKALDLWAGMPTIRLKVLTGKPATCAIWILLDMLLPPFFVFGRLRKERCQLSLAPDSLSLYPY